LAEAPLIDAENLFRQPGPLHSAVLKRDRYEHDILQFHSVKCV